MSSENGHTRTLASFALETDYSDLSPEVIHATKRVILDTIACTVPGVVTEIGQSLVNLKVAQGGKPEATLVVKGVRLPCASVSYVHAQAANAMDADETLLNFTHFANCIVMPALAVAESSGASGKDVISAVALGFDVGARVGLSLPTYMVSPSGQVQFVPVFGYSWAIFGTVATVGRLLKLTELQLTHALGIAYWSAPLHRPAVARHPQDHFFGMTKYTPYGAIAEAGINAVLLAAQGFTDETRVLDPEREFWRGMGALSCNWDVMLRDLRKRWFITETSLKPYPICRPLTLPVQLFCRIVREEKLSAEEIDGVTVKVAPSYLLRLLQQRKSLSHVETAFNLPYALSMAAAGFPPGPQWQRPENLQDQKLMAFAAKVRYEFVPDRYQIFIDQLKAEGYFKRTPTEVEVEARGKRFSAYGEYAKGDPWTPESTMNDQELREKFREFAREILSKEKIEKAISEVFTLEKAPNVSGLVACLH